MRIRWGYVLLGALVVAGVLAAAAGGSHFRYGNYTWVSTGATSVEFSIANGWRRDGYSQCFNTPTGACSGADGFPLPGDVIEEDIGGTVFDPGDGNVISSPGIGLRYLVTSVDVANNWLFALALDPADLPALDTTIDKTYTAPGNVTAFTDSTARIGDNINAANGPYRVETIVNVGGTNHPPVSAMPPIVNCPTSGPCTFQVPGNDADGDTLAYRLSTEAESGIATQPGPPFAPNAAGISASGLYSWNTTGATLAPGSNPTYYATQVTIEDRDAAGALKSKIAVDFLIRLINVVGATPTFVNPTPACSSTVSGNVGTALTFTVKASDADQADLVTLTAAGVPPGATLTPALPTSGNPVETAFSWTSAAAGTTIVTFAATDNQGNQALCALTLAITQQQPAQTPTVSTVIHISNAADDPAPITGNTAVVPAGTTVHDSATVGGTTNGTPTGTVLFRFYSTADCSDAGVADTGPVTLVGGVAHPSANRGPLAAGNFGFRAFYTSNDATKWNNAESGCESLSVVAPPAPASVLLVIDDESIATGTSGKSKRTELPDFAGNHGGTVMLKTGQTGDEGWFAPTCIPSSWLGTNGNTCLTGADRDSAIDNYFGIGSGVPSQNRLDKIPGVMPLRALGIGKLVGKQVCAVVYDSDVSINYGGSLFTDANLQGETLGVVAFRVDAVTTKKGTLSQVTLTILDSDECGDADWQLLNAPVPKSSSVPNDRVAPGSTARYKQEFTWPGQPLFF